MKVRQFIIGVAAVSVLVVMSVPAQADHAWGNYHWARISIANPFPLVLVDSVTDDWQPEFIVSVDDWDVEHQYVDGWAGPKIFNLGISGGSKSKKTRKRCSMVSGKIRVCNASYGKNGWLGLASINLDSNRHITQGTAKVNDSYSSYWAVNKDEKYNVMCQEIGHLFGLGHTSTNGNDDNTCMDYSDDTSPYGPNAHDFNQLKEIYEYADGYNSYADGDTSDGGTCNAPPGKGCNKNNGSASAGEVPPMGIRVHGNSRFETWVASDGRGGYWIHYMILAPQN